MEHETKSISDYLAMLRRQRKILVFSIVIISLIGVYVGYSMPAMYRSTSHFLIEQQDIPRDVVQSTVTSYVDEQIQEVRQRVMSSGNLLVLIQEYGLYPDFQPSGSVETRVDEFRLNTLLETEVFDVMNPRSGRAMLATISFTLSFDYGDPVIAQQVAESIASLYLTENIRSRTDQVQGTLEFILSDIERYSQEVDRTGILLSDFKERNLGNLPELMNYNLQSIERAERQIDGLDREIREANNRKLQFSSDLSRLGPAETAYDETGAPILNPTEQLAALQREKLRLISIYSAEHPDVIQIQKEIEILSNATSGGGTYLADLQAQVDDARLALAQDKQRYSETHPDVVRARRSLDSLESELAVAITEKRPFQATSLPENPYAQQLNLRIAAEDSNIRSLTTRKREVQQKLIELESKVALSPRVEREYEGLNRDNQTAIANLNEARSKFDDAQQAEKLESGGSGDRFTIVEHANLPLEPFKPNRTAILLLAFVLACGFGIVLATVIDTMDDTIKGSRDVYRLINTPPLAVIPYLETETEQRRRVLSNVGTVALMAGSVVVAVLIARFAG